MSVLLILFVVTIAFIGALLGARAMFFGFGLGLGNPWGSSPFYDAEKCNSQTPRAPDCCGKKGTYKGLCVNNADTHVYDPSQGKWTKKENIGKVTSSPSNKPTDPTTTTFTKPTTPTTPTDYNSTRPTVGTFVTPDTGTGTETGSTFTTTTTTGGGGGGGGGGAAFVAAVNSAFGMNLGSQSDQDSCAARHAAAEPTRAQAHLLWNGGDRCGMGIGAVWMGSPDPGVSARAWLGSPDHARIIRGASRLACGAGPTSSVCIAYR